ncbi:hypothetical protein ACFE04_021559 [Oxalis oulophora]
MSGPITFCFFVFLISHFPGYTRQTDKRFHENGIMTPPVFLRSVTQIFPSVSSMTPPGTFSEFNQIFTRREISNEIFSPFVNAIQAFPTDTHSIQEKEDINLKQLQESLQLYWKPFYDFPLELVRWVFYHLFSSMDSQTKFQFWLFLNLEKSEILKGFNKSTLLHLSYSWKVWIAGNGYKLKIIQHDNVECSVSGKYDCVWRKISEDEKLEFTDFNQVEDRRPLKETGPLRAR